MINIIENETRLTEDKKQAAIARERESQLQNEQARQLLEDHKDPATRIFGHVLFSPKFSNDVRPGSSSQPRLRDWALIELHPGKHTSPLSELKNEVTVAYEGGTKLGRAIHFEGLPTKNCRFWVNAWRNTVTLRGTIPETEMKTPTEDQPGIVVAKHGASSEFTAGAANNVMSLKRESINNTPFISEEWCIFGPRNDAHRRRTNFSDLGDSGACVWDSRARIGGVITSGTESDITYATPIEWLLEDIRSYGYDVELCE